MLSLKVNDSLQLSFALYIYNKAAWKIELERKANIAYQKEGYIVSLFS